LVKAKSIEKLFLHILIYTYLLLPVLLFFSRSKVKERWLIGVYGIIFFSILAAYFYGYIIGSLLYISIYTFLEYLFFTLFLAIHITNKKFRIAIYILSILFFGFQIFSYISIKNSEFATAGNLDSMPVGIETILIFIYITFFFYESFQKTSSEFIYNHPCFWLSIGMLLYLGGTFFFNILVNHLDDQQADQYWYLTYIADIVKNIFFGVAIIMYSHIPQKENLHHQNHVPYLDLDMN